jgi:hypothetical protein
MLDNIRKKDIR